MGVVGVWLVGGRLFWFVGVLKVGREVKKRGRRKKKRKGKKKKRKKKKREGCWECLFVIDQFGDLDGKKKRSSRGGRGGRGRRGR